MNLSSRFFIASRHCARSCLIYFQHRGKVNVSFSSDQLDWKLISDQLFWLKETKINTRRVSGCNFMLRNIDDGLLQVFLGSMKLILVTDLTPEVATWTRSSHMGVRVRFCSKLHLAPLCSFCPTCMSFVFPDKCLQCILGFKRNSMLSIHTRECLQKCPFSKQARWPSLCVIP